MAHVSLTSRAPEVGSRGGNAHASGATCVTRLDANSPVRSRYEKQRQVPGSPYGTQKDASEPQAKACSQPRQGVSAPPDLFARLDPQLSQYQTTSTVPATLQANVW